MMPPFFLWLCYGKWLMLFSLKLQRDNRQNALAVAHADAEEPGKKPHKQNALFMDPAKGKTR